MGHVTICRTEHSHRESTVSITIRHDGRDVEAVLSLADYALVATGQGRIQAETRSHQIGPFT